MIADKVLRELSDFGNQALFEPGKAKGSDQKHAGGFLIAHFKH